MKPSAQHLVSAPVTHSLFQAFMTWGAARGKKKEKARLEKASSRRAVFVFSRLPERLEEARLPKFDSTSFNRVNI